MASRTIFAGEDGTLPSAWNGGTSTFKVADQSASEAVYVEGLAMGSVGSDTFLYATNFKGGKLMFLIRITR